MAATAQWVRSCLRRGWSVGILEGTEGKNGRAGGAWWVYGAVDECACVSRVCCGDGSAGVGAGMLCCRWAGEWQRLRGCGYRIVEGRVRSGQVLAGMSGARRTRGVKQARATDAMLGRRHTRSARRATDSRRSAGEEVVGGGWQRPADWQRQTDGQAGRQRFLVAGISPGLP